MRMDILLFSNAWHEQALARQIAWGVAAVSTVLLFIFAALNIFGKPEPNSPSKAAFSGRMLLPFVTFGAWGLVVSFHQHLSLPVCITVGFASGLAGILGSRFVMPFIRQTLIHDHFDLQRAGVRDGGREQGLQLPRRMDPDGIPEPVPVLLRRVHARDRRRPAGLLGARVRLCRQLPLA